MPKLDIAVNNKLGIAVVVVFGMGFIFTYYFITGELPFYPETPVSKQEIQQVRNYCDQMEVPSGFKKESESEFVKIASALKTIKYASDMPPSSVREYFLNLYKPPEWEFEEHLDLSVGQYKFYKGKYSITIEFYPLPITGEYKYSTSCGWRNVRL
jgi:hypothetical protein